MIEYKICLKTTLFIISFYLFYGLTPVCGHGRLIDPPSRSSAWRLGYKTAINYNDNQLFCGGFTTQWNVNKGKCGICGDPYNGKRDNEAPDGKYAKPLVITRTYRKEDIIEAKVELTANHNGFFVFKVCPTINNKTEVTQNCLNDFQLKVLNSHSNDKYIVPSKRAEIFTVVLKLPNGLTCNRCVFQWTYTSGNNWGNCGNGTSAVGCGPQETFRGCADIQIVNKNTANRDEKYKTTPKYVSNNEMKDKFKDMTKYSSTPNTKIIQSIKTSNSFKKCQSTGMYSRVPNMNDWCQTNCNHNYCPKSHCICFQTN